MKNIYEPLRSREGGGTRTLVIPPLKVFNKTVIKKMIFWFLDAAVSGEVDIGRLQISMN